MGQADGIESELKYRLDPPQHERLQRELVRLLGPPQILVQRNRFYDSEDGRLRQARASLRLRLENQRLRQTCKRHLSSETGYHRHFEDECWLSTVLWPWCQAEGSVIASILPLPPEIARLLAGAPLRCLGGFDNQRLAWSHDGEEIALDRSVFGTRVDHELEVETQDVETSRQRWRERFQHWDIPEDPQPATKLHRFLALRGDRRS